MQALETMAKNRDAIELDINMLVYYMNGGLDYDDAWLLTSDQRMKMGKVIEKHFAAMNPKGKQQL